jgi:hypothetical protein
MTVSAGSLYTTAKPASINSFLMRGFASCTFLQNANGTERYGIRMSHGPGHHHRKTDCFNRTGENVHSGVRSNLHDAIVEALQVDAVLGDGELVLVVLAGDLELVVKRHGGSVAILGDVDDGNHLEGEHHLVGDVVLGPEGRLVLEVHEGGIIVGRIAGHAGHHAGALIERDGEHGEDVDGLILGERSLEAETDQVLAGELHQAHRLAELLGVALEAEVCVEREYRGPGLVFTQT